MIIDNSIALKHWTQNLLEMFVQRMFSQTVLAGIRNHLATY